MKRYVIIGCGNAGFKAALKIREFDVNSEITLITDEKYPPYCRCLLTYFIEEKIDENFLFENNIELIKKNKINFIFNNKVEFINNNDNSILLFDRKKIYYDKLLIATGGKPLKPKFPYKKNFPVFTLRNFDDALAIREHFKRGDTCVFEGGGLVSLKTLLALYAKGINIIWIVASSHILSFLVDKESAKIIENILKTENISIFLSDSIEEVIKNDDTLLIKTIKNREIKANGVVVGKGVKPELITSEHFFDFDNGYFVNEYLQSNKENIYVAGDCAIIYDKSHEKKWKIPLWPLAGKQGIIAGYNMVNGNKFSYDGDIPVNSFSVFDNFIITGGKKKIDEDEKDLYFEDKDFNYNKNSFTKKIYKIDGRLKGYFLLNDLKDAGKYYYDILK